MLDYARRAQSLVAGRSRQDIETDEVLNLALARLLEIIGEAATRVPSEKQAEFAEIPWSDIVGVRNRLVHGYDLIELDIVWLTATNGLPPLVRALEDILGHGAIGVVTEKCLMGQARIDIPQAAIAEFCRWHHIRKLSLFGSVIRDDFRPESDIDILVEFDRDHIPGFIGLAGMEIELSHVLAGRKVDMNTPGGISRYYRDEVMAEAEVLYDAT